MTVNRQLSERGLDQLIQKLNEDHQVLGPVWREGVIAYGPIASLKDLPRGVMDDQAPGRYRTVKSGSAFFHHVLGPFSWKQYLHPPRQKLFSASRSEEGFDVKPEPLPEVAYAFFGARACEIAAIRRQDHVFQTPEFTDEFYRARRKNCFIVAVECVTAAPTCFCTSMETGPEVNEGFDIALTEVCTETEHFFIARWGSEAGERVLKGIESQPAAPKAVEKARDLVEANARRVSENGSGFDTSGIRDALYSHANSSHWDKIAERCINCGNCTMVCPTCFCTTVEDVTSLQGENAERWRRWDSCFTLDFSYIHGGEIRHSAKSRYRQWMTHKLGSWQDQFGESGCVGCGRCIVWCPVGIDITEEARAIQEEARGD